MTDPVSTPPVAGAPVAAGRRRTGGLWKLAVSLALLAILAWTQDLSGIWRIMGQASPLWLAAATVAMFAEQTMTAATWALLLRARGLQVGVGQVIHIFYLSFFLGTWLPSSTGPDFVRAWYLAKEVDGYEAVGSMLLLRFISLLGLGLFAVGGIMALPAGVPPELPALAAGVPPELPALAAGVSPEGVPPEAPALAAGVPLEALALALLLLAGSVGVLVIGFTEGPRRWATRLLDAIGLGAVGRIFGKLHDALHAYRSAPAALVQATMISLLVQFLRILTIYCAGVALGTSVPLLDYLVLVPVTTLITLVPVSLSGLGVREGAFVWFFGRAGMDEAAAFSLGLLVFGLSLVLWIIGALLYWRERA